MLRVCGRQQYLTLAGVGKPTGEETRRGDQEGKEQVSEGPIQSGMPSARPRGDNEYEYVRSARAEPGALQCLQIGFLPHCQPMHGSLPH